MKNEHEVPDSAWDSDSVSRPSRRTKAAPGCGEASERTKGAREESRRGYCRNDDECAGRALTIESLQRSETLYRILVDNLPGGAVFILNRDLRYVLAAGTALDVAGLTPDDLEGKTIWEALQEGNWLRHEPLLKEALRGRPFREEHSDYGRYYVSKGVPIRAEDGNVTHVLVVSYDITDRRRAEEELRKANETLEAQVAQRTAVAERRIRDLSRLAAQLSEAEHRERKRLSKLLHDDVQQLILAAKLRLGGLAGRSDTPEMKKGLAQIEELLTECLAVSRDLTVQLSPPVLQYGTLAEILEWLGEWYGEKHGLAVNIDIVGEVPHAPEHLRLFLFQAVRELLLNVVKHSRKLEACVRLEVGQQDLYIRIEDGGEGFEPDVVEAGLLKPRGIGLFNIRERLQALDGRLEILAAPGGGARFQLVVPLARMEKPVPREREESAPGPAIEGDQVKDKIRLLVVDDHHVVREGLVGLLRSCGELEVVGEAADGEEALQLAWALRPDAILMDAEMPVMHGIEATRQIKQRLPQTKVIAISVHDEAPVRNAMTAAGADAYVCKSAAADDLVDAIHEAFRNDDA